MLAIACLVLLFCLSFVLSGLIRLIASRQGWFDMPNARSSHIRPTPKGGGLAFALTSSLAFCALYFSGYLPWRPLLALLLALPLALMGWWDDLYHLGARARLAIQAVISFSGLILMGGLPVLPVFSVTADFGWLGYLVGLIGMIWLINLYNFMDGLDSLAGLEACFVMMAVVLILLLAEAGINHVIFLAPLVAVLGFVCWNLPPAKLFMGDAGSNYLGYLLGMLGLYSIAIGHLNVWSWAILLGTFIVDSTVTLCRRMRRGQVWYHAHRTHAYQHWARRLESHGRVVTVLMLINVAWLLPLAYWSTAWPQGGLALTVVAYAPLAWIAWKSGAGVEALVEGRPGA